MSKGTKKLKVWVVLLQGSALALGSYLLGVLLLAFIAVQGDIGNAAIFPVAAGLCFLGALVGGLIVARRLPWGTLPSALLGTLCYVLALMLVGVSFWERLVINGRGGILLLCAVAGGIAAGLLGSRKKVRRKRG